MALWEWSESIDKRVRGGGVQEQQHHPASRSKHAPRPSRTPPPLPALRALLIILTLWESFSWPGHESTGVSCVSLVLNDNNNNNSRRLQAHGEQKLEQSVVAASSVLPTPRTPAVHVRAGMSVHDGGRAGGHWLGQCVQ